MFTTLVLGKFCSLQHTTEHMETINVNICDVNPAFDFAQTVKIAIGRVIFGIALSYQEQRSPTLLCPLKKKIPNQALHHGSADKGSEQIIHFI